MRTAYTLVLYTLLAAAAVGASPPAGAATEKIIYDFRPSAGAFSHGGNLVLGPDGALYGASTGGGPKRDKCPHGCGTIFKLTPPASGQGMWTGTILYFLADADRDVPGPLLLGSDGTLYVESYDGGVQGKGSVFRLKPPAGSGVRWTKEDLYDFAAGPDGAHPAGGLIADPSGALYGVTQSAGASGCCGTVFKLTPPAKSGDQWTETTLFRFGSRNNYPVPNGPLQRSQAGALYFTTTAYGSAVDNLAYVLTPQSDGSYLFSVLAEFKASYPNGPLLIGADGVLFGAAARFRPGNGLCTRSPANCGSVYALLRPAAGQSTRPISYIYTFMDPNGGILPASLVSGPKGSLYGLAVHGGIRDPNYQGGYGLVFQLTPPSGGNATWSKTTLYEFKGPPDPYYPNQLIKGPRGVLYGSAQGGSQNLGAVFEIDP